MTNPNDSKRYDRYRDPIDRPSRSDAYQGSDSVNRNLDRNIEPRNVEPRTVDQSYDNDLVNQHPDVANGRRTSTTGVAYRDGYERGRSTEYLREENLRTRDNDNAARGLLLGIGLTSLIGIVVGTIFFVNAQQRESTVPVRTVAPAPSIVPSVSPSPVTVPAPSPTTNTTIIERTEVVPVPVPQNQAPAVQPQQAPPAVTQPTTVPPQQAPATTGTTTAPDATAPTGTAAPSGTVNGTTGTTGTTTGAPGTGAAQ